MRQASLLYEALDRGGGGVGGQKEVKSRNSLRHSTCISMRPVFGVVRPYIII